jgi:hypothetical protein
MNRSVLLLLLFVTSPLVSDSTVPSGIFSYGLAKNFPQSPSVELDYIAGMSAAFTWKDLEPQEGKYDFSQIITALELGSRSGKKINIVLYAGNKSPEWLYQKGIPSISWKRRWKEDQAKMRNEEYSIEKAPVFWDSAYLAAWKKLVTALSEKISDYPALGYVLITGPTPKDYTTGTVIRYNEDWKEVLANGYTHELHLNSWLDMIEHYCRVFPKQTLVVALGPLRPGISELTLSTAIVDFVIIKKLANVAFLCVVLNDTWFADSHGAIELRNLFKRAANNGHSFGYQMNYSVYRMDKFQSSENKTILDLSKTLDIAVADGASWIEIWHDDVILPKKNGAPNPVYQPAIIRAAQVLGSGD